LTKDVYELNNLAKHLDKPELQRYKEVIQSLQNCSGEKCRLILDSLK